MIHIRLLTPFFLLLAVVISSAPTAGADTGQQTADGSQHIPNVQATFGYWNDNFIVGNLFGTRLSDGGDDHVTASFWFQAGFEDRGRWWLVDIYHNILTNKTGGYRTDLLTCRISHERMAFGCSVQGGLGIIGGGNFGGQDIQNVYHRIAGISRIDLDYVNENKLGLVAFARCKRPLLHLNPGDLGLFTGVSHRGEVGPSNVRFGFEADTRPVALFEHISLSLQGRAGYIHYYDRGRRLSPIFDGGFTWGLLASFMRTERLNATLWVTGNQYGRKNPHFGVSLTFGHRILRKPGLSDIMYP